MIDLDKSPDSGFVLSDFELEGFWNGDIGCSPDHVILIFLLFVLEIVAL